MYAELANRLCGIAQLKINAAGKLFLQETELEPEALIARLQAITANKPDQRIFVRGDKALAYGKVMEVMGNISRAGFTKVALVAEVPNVPTPPRGQRRTNR